MIKKKITITLLTLLTLFTFLVSCSSNTDKTKTIKIGTILSSSHPVNTALKEIFVKRIEEKTDGKIKVQVFDSGVLGGEKQLYDSVRNGNIDLCAIGTVMWNEVDKLSIPDWPFIFRDLAHAKKVYLGEIGDEMAKDLEEKGKVIFLGWFPNGARVFSANRTIAKLNDFKGLRMRMPNNPIHIKIGELLGANVTPLPLGEVFSALEQKVVDGQDNPLSSFISEGYYEVQSDVFESNHIITSIELLGSKKLWSTLTEEEINIIKEASYDAALYAWDLYEKSISADKEFLKEKGIKITEPSEELRNEMKNKMMPIYNDLYNKYDWAKDMVERINSIE